MKDVLKYFAASRGIETVGYGSIILPVDSALGNQQLGPIIVMSAAKTYESSGLIKPESPFPFTVVDDNEGLMDIAVTTQDSKLPLSVAYLFMDYEIESIVKAHRMDLSKDWNHMQLDDLVERLYIEQEEPTKNQRSPIEFSF